MRIRSFAPLLALVALAAASPGEARAVAPSADSITVEQRPPVVGDSLVLHPALDLPALQVADTHRAPAPRSHSPLSMFSMLGFAVGATKSKRPTRRARGVKVPDVPLFLDSDVHVMRDGELTIVRGGVLVEDTELEDDEIEDLIKHGVVRPAKHAELESLETAGNVDAAATLAREQEQEIAALQTAHAAVLADADASGNLTPAKREKLVAKQGEELAALREQHTAALNKLSA
jgi:hypothetical protein